MKRCGGGGGLGAIASSFAAISSSSCSLVALSLQPQLGRKYSVAFIESHQVSTVAARTQARMANKEGMSRLVISSPSAPAQQAGGLFMPACHARLLSGRLRSSNEGTWVAFPPRL